MAGVVSRVRVGGELLGLRLAFVWWFSLLLELSAASHSSCHTFALSRSTTHLAPLPQSRSPSAPGSSGHGIKGFWTKAKDLGHKAAQSARRIASDLKSHVESGVQAGATLFDKQRKPAQLEVAPAAIQEAVALYGMREGDRTAALG